MSATVVDFLTFADVARMIEQAVRDKTYRQTPLGQLVGRYIRWCRNERGLVEITTIKDYEATLARMSVTLARHQPRDVTLDDLRLVIDLWADREANTRRKVTSTIRGFWRWAMEEGFVDVSPLEREALARVVNGEQYVGDKSVDNAAQRARTKLRKAVA